MRDLISRDTFFTDLIDFRRDFDEIFNRILVGRPQLIGDAEAPKASGFMPAMESYLDKAGKKFVCRLALPGIEARDVDIQINGNLLTIKGERKLTRKTKEVDMMDEEIVYGQFERTFTLPEGVVADKLVAEYQDGVLEITAPVAAAALPRKVEIKVTPASRQIAA